MVKCPSRTVADEVQYVVDTALQRQRQGALGLPSGSSKANAAANIFDQKTDKSSADLYFSYYGKSRAWPGCCALRLQLPCPHISAALGPCVCGRMFNASTKHAGGTLGSQSVTAQHCICSQVLNTHAQPVSLRRTGQERAPITWRLLRTRQTSRTRL